MPIGNFYINLDTITKGQLISLRKFVPIAEYRLLKNRKSARLCRQRRKVERSLLKNQVTDFESLNIKLQQEIRKAAIIKRQDDKNIQELLAANANLQ